MASWLGDVQAVNQNLWQVKLRSARPNSTWVLQSVELNFEVKAEGKLNRKRGSKQYP
jgi:hypothetical protein